MKNYELTVISREESIPAVEATIHANGGTIVNQRNLGRHQFAYPIGKETAGYYIVYRLNLEEPKAIDALSRRFNLTENLLRYLFVEVPATTTMPSLEAEDLVEAKELERSENTESKSAAQPTEADQERDKKLDEQLSKLLGDDADSSKEEHGGL